MRRITQQRSLFVIGHESDFDEKGRHGRAGKNEEGRLAYASVFPAYSANELFMKQRRQTPARLLLRAPRNLGEQVAQQIAGRLPPIERVLEIGQLQCPRIAGLAAQDVRFDPARAGARGAVAVQREHQVGVPGVGRPHPILQRRVRVVLAGQPHVVAAIPEARGQPQPHGERDLLFRDAGAIDCPAIIAAVPRIDEHANARTDGLSPRSFR